MNETSFFKKRKVTAAFSVFALVSGFIFLESNTTGNAISASSSTVGFNPISFIGLLLVFCSAILAYHTAKNR